MGCNVCKKRDAAGYCCVYCYQAAEKRNMQIGRDRALEDLKMWQGSTVVEQQKREIISLRQQLVCAKQKLGIAAAERDSLNRELNVLDKGR